WESGAGEGEVFSFTIEADAAVVEVPPASEWLQALPDGHPRVYIRPEQLDELLSSRDDKRAGLWSELKTIADELLDEPHEIEEPAFLPDRQRDYNGWFALWANIMWESRRFVKGAETLGLAYLASGDVRYARAACERMASISLWDPEGSSNIPHNDEAHMSVIWHGAKACDWVWDQFTDEERALVINQFRRRGELTYEHMHDRGSYGVTRFDSHAGREVVFLALIAMVFSDHIPDAAKWLEWLRPVLCGIWPIWAEDDGAWAEGPSYGMAYVQIMTMFCSALKAATGVDLYRRPFWRNHAHWRRVILPAYAEWMGFGDHSEVWENTLTTNAELVALIDREVGDGEFAGYIAQLRDTAKTKSTPAARAQKGYSAQRYLFAEPASRPAADAASVLHTFPDVGYAAIRTEIDDPERDVALILRSSPYGAVSHSHANNNDFIIHVAGKAMAMPSGYYDGYGSDHHSHWVWPTKSHNCITLSDAGQILRSHDSRGEVANAFEDDHLAYFVGIADASYADRAERCRRHVVFLKGNQCFVMVDEFIGKPGIISSLQWNIHSWNEFAVNEAARSFTIEREVSALTGHFLWHQNGFFSLSDGWDPSPSTVKKNDQWRHQYHLRFTPTHQVSRRTLGVVLCPSHGQLAPPAVRTELVDGVEIAHIGNDVVQIGAEGIAELVVGGTTYTITDEGITC
ncbi:MAG TPA: DUF4962 domain-containing protein, partial [Armatimonadota bacterium]|nr:DUF4962 domain-containing protein [Armatimonadota bacterium]